RARPASLLSILALHDALPISEVRRKSEIVVHAEPERCGGTGKVGLADIVVLVDERDVARLRQDGAEADVPDPTRGVVVVVLERLDRKSTRLNSSHVSISYAVF